MSLFIITVIVLIPHIDGKPECGTFANLALYSDLTSESLNDSLT